MKVCPFYIFFLLILRSLFLKKKKKDIEDDTRELTHTILTCLNLKLATLRRF